MVFMVAIQKMFELDGSRWGGDIANKFVKVKVGEARPEYCLGRLLEIEE